MRPKIVSTTEYPIDNTPHEWLPIAGENLTPGMFVEFNEDGEAFAKNNTDWRPFEGVVIRPAKRGEHVLIAARAMTVSGSYHIYDYWVIEAK